MPATKDGIYHNLKETEYLISNGEVRLFFSSDVYRKKFLQRYKANREQFLKRIKRIAPNTTLNPEFLADIELYEEIEKRGFRVTMKGVEMSCQDLDLYALRQMTKPNTLDWFATQKPKLTERERSMV